MRRSQNQKDVSRARDVLGVLTAPDAKRVTLVEAKSNPQPQGKAIYVARTGKLVFLGPEKIWYPKISA